jgi:hypothetical protein
LQEHRVGRRRNYLLSQVMNLCVERQVAILTAGHRPPERSSEIKEVAIQGLAPGRLPRARNDNGASASVQQVMREEIGPRKPRPCPN